MIGPIIDFANELASDLKDVFANGQVAQLINSERLEAFGDEARDVVRALTDGQITFDDILGAGQLILDGIGLAADFIIAGVVDIANAIGAFFQNVGEAILDWLGLGSPW